MEAEEKKRTERNWGMGAEEKKEREMKLQQKRKCCQTLQMVFDLQPSTSIADYLCFSRRFTFLLLSHFLNPFLPAFDNAQTLVLGHGYYYS